MPLIVDSLSAMDSAPVCEPFDNIFGENAATREFRAILHQSQKSFFALAADHRGIAQVDDKSAALEILCCAQP
jgi:hypothetical protein